MTSFVIAAGAPLVLALVPCLFSGLNPEDPAVIDASEAAADPVETAAVSSAWWKPASLGMDNYS